MCRHRFGVQLLQNPPLCSRTILTPTRALLREPGSDEGHLEGVGEGVQGVEGLRVHGAHQRESAPLKLNTRTRGFGLFSTRIQDSK